MTRRPPARSWALQVLVLAGAAFVVFWGFYALDVLLAVGESSDRGLSAVLDALPHYLRFDAAALTDAVSGLAAAMLAIFGIVVTVVSIIVQLAANRYTGVARRFFRDRVNLAVLGFYVVACVVGLWLSVALRGDFVPRHSLVLMLALTAFGLVLMAPYFGYVFWFLEPANIIGRIRDEALSEAERGVGSEDAAVLDRAQTGTLSALEELSDIASSSIGAKDKLIASAAVDALGDFTKQYLSLKPRARSAWYRIGEGLRANPDFVAMAPASLAELQARRAWVEWKALRQYMTLVPDALAAMPDVAYLIAIDTRYVAEAAALARDAEVVALALRYMNSFLRATLNARSVRSAYNVLHQYRLLAEQLLSRGEVETPAEIARHLRYYGDVAFDLNLPFVTETVAFDLGTLAARSSELGSAAEARVLGEFLELDRPFRSRAQAQALLGVRKAQAKLGASYLARGEQEKARRIARDMSEEPAERLALIRAQLESVTTQEFWEITDRGGNFEFMPERERAELATFFAWTAEAKG